jgi:addiction module HigA family antidote
MEMFNPPHPGEVIREDCLKPLDLSVTAAAKWLGVSRVTLSELLNGHNGVTAEMAIRLERQAGDPPSRGCATSCPMTSGAKKRQPGSRSRKFSSSVATI